MTRAHDARLEADLRELRATRKMLMSAVENAREAVEHARHVRERELGRLRRNDRYPFRSVAAAADSPMRERPHQLPLEANSEPLSL
jgi:hypothetical protein